jgi:hypothetical protein
MTYCYICKNQFSDTDLIVPLNVSLNLPFGNFLLTILMHYMCGLNYYLDNISNVDKLTKKDRKEIQDRLMLVVNAINQGTIQ